MQASSKIHVGLDVHKDSISVAAAEPGRASARLIGKVARCAQIVPSWGSQRCHSSAGNAASK